MLKSAWVRGWLYHGQHLTASALYGRELWASGNVAFYVVIGVAFPIIGLIMGLAGSGFANTARALPDSSGPGGPPGPGGPEPVRDPPGGGQLADADAGELTVLRSG